MTTQKTSFSNEINFLAVKSRLPRPLPPLLRRETTVFLSAGSPGTIDVPAGFILRKERESWRTPYGSHILNLRSLPFCWKSSSQNRYFRDLWRNALSLFRFVGEQSLDEPNPLSWPRSAPGKAGSSKAQSNPGHFSPHSSPKNRLRTCSSAGRSGPLRTWSGTRIMSSAIFGMAFCRSAADSGLGSCMSLRIQPHTLCVF